MVASSSTTHSLAARDGTIVTIKASAAEQSKTLSGWLEEMEDSSTAFPVSAIEADGETLKEAVEFCEQVAAAPGWDIDDERDFPQDRFLAIAAVANFLGMDKVLETMGRWLSRLVRSRSACRVRQTLNVPQDMSIADQEQAKKEPLLQDDAKVDDDIDDAAFACLKKCDARVLRCLKSVNRFWARHACAVLAGTEWRKTPIWSAPPESYADAELLRSDDEVQRLEGLRQLGRLDHAVDLPAHAVAIIGRFHDSDYDVRSEALSLLRKCEPAALAPHVTRMLEHAGSWDANVMVRRRPAPRPPPSRPRPAPFSRRPPPPPPRPLTPLRRTLRRRTPSRRSPSLTRAPSSPTSPRSSPASSPRRTPTTTRRSAPPRSGSSRSRRSATSPCSSSAGARPAPRSPLPRAPLPVPPAPARAPPPPPPLSPPPSPSPPQAARRAARSARRPPPPPRPPL